MLTIIHARELSTYDCKVCFMLIECLSVEIHSELWRSLGLLNKLDSLCLNCILTVLLVKCVIVMCLNCILTIDLLQNKQVNNVRLGRRFPHVYFALGLFFFRKMWVAFRVPKHVSAFTGWNLTLEIISGHDGRFVEVLRLNKECFFRLYGLLIENGLQNTRSISVQE